MKRILPFLIILVVLAVALGAGWYLTRSAKDSAQSPNAVSINNSAPASPTPVAKVTNSADPGAQPPHAIGPENAPAVLEEFGDFECPPCGLLHPVLKTMEKEFGPRLRVVFREFPLVPTHPHALAAARSAEAAGLQGKFWEMHDLLFENQRTWHEQFDARPTFEGYAQKLGLDMERFRRDVSSQVVEQRIFLDGKRAHGLGVKGTPTVFLNGREVPFESLAPEKLRVLINVELASTGK
ncbi:MAG TPA: thioredoxin domain-containing protein [Pyrinomonadaceae bacterium]|nr:thioredoxin domain-containing protein [Pyrinomonadaceae bacterium]